MIGITYKMPAEEYHSDPCAQPSLSASIASILWSKTPYHAWLAHPRLNPNYQSEEKRIFDIGSAAHALVLENDESRFAVIDAADWRTKAAKEQRDEAYAANKIPLLPKDYAIISAMGKAARDYLTTSQLAGVLDNGNAEVSMSAEYEDITLRGRLDWLTKDRRIILDYKTTTSARAEDFYRHISQFSYDIQAAEYWTLNQLNGGMSAKFIWFVQETTAPYMCSLIGCSPALMSMGHQKLQWCAHRWRDCLSTNEWPGYEGRIQWVEPKPWDMASTEEKAGEVQQW
jgi:hypothetical protein